MSKRSSSKIKTMKVSLLLKHAEVSCLYCSKNITKREDLTIDHVLPKSMGGPDDETNLAFCCTKCNKDKRELLLTQYLKAFEVKVTPEIARFL